MASKTDPLFEHIENLYTKAQRPTKLGLKFDPYMTQRWLSMHPAGFWPAQASNLVSNKLPDWATEYLLWYMVPQARQAPRTAYAKKAKASGEIDTDTLVKLAKHFNVRLVHARQVYQLLTQQGINVPELFGKKG